MVVTILIPNITFLDVCYKSFFSRHEFIQHILLNAHYTPGTSLGSADSDSGIFFQHSTYLYIFKCQKTEKKTHEELLHINYMFSVLVLLNVCMSWGLALFPSLDYKMIIKMMQTM